MKLRITREEQRLASERYRLVGVHCISCKYTIEKELSQIPGVEKAEVDSNTGTLTLVLGESVDRHDVVSAVRKLGYDVVLEKATLKSPDIREGMAETIIRTLKRLPGLVEVRVYEAGRIVQVELDPEQTSIEEIVDALDRIGVRVEEYRGGEASGYSGLTLALASASVAALIAGTLSSIQPLTVMGGLLAFIVALYEFHLPALKAIVHGYLVMDTLLAIGTGAAFALSLYGLIAGGPTFFDAVVFITFFVVVGRVAESRLRRRAEKLVEGAGKILPDRARVEKDGVDVFVDVDKVVPGDLVVVRAGERIPVDGRVENGEGDVDESPVTGESMPRHVSPGDLVLAGSTLVRGWLRITALRTGRYRLVARALDAAREAGLYKPRLQEIADRIVSVFVPVVLLAAIATVVGHMVFGSSLVEAVIAGATVLVVACPCALGIAIPTAIAAGVARAYRLGLILRRPDVLDRLSGVRVAAFDKTGTLTRGRPVVVDMVVLDDRFDEKEVARLAAAVESESMHPIAKALVDYYSAKWDESPPRPVSLDEIPGAGVVGVVEGRSVAVGGTRILEGFALEVPDVKVEGYTRVYVVIDDAIAGIFGVEDDVREDAAWLVSWLREKGVEVYILSGDSRKAVERVARELGVPGENVLGGLDPSEKAGIISKLKHAGPVMYVGDGVNDGPALAEADVGIAVNEALDVAKQAGDIVMARNDLRLIAWMYRLARITSRTVRLNLFWAFAYNIVLIPVAAGLFAGWGIAIGPETAALAMSLSSISVTSNSVRILYWRPDR